MFVRKNFRHLITISSFLNDESEGHNTSSKEDTRQLGNNSNVLGANNQTLFFMGCSSRFEGRMKLNNKFIIQ